MSDPDVKDKPTTETKSKSARPPMWKVILLNDDYTPRDFVTKVLGAIFRMGEGEALGVMMTAHQKGSCVVAVYTREIAETKSAQATDMGRREGYPLAFTTERDQ